MIADKNMNASSRKTIVVIGHGMVGHRFCQRMIEFDTANEYKIVTFCEEPRAAYDRVGLTTFFAHRDAEKLMLANLKWYRENGIELHMGDRADVIDREKKVIHSQKGVDISYDMVVLATGSYPFVPPVPGIEKSGVFAYRTIEDLEKIIARGKRSKKAAVIGGGLLGLEAAKATFDLGLETHVIEFASRLMPRQVDEKGSALLVRKIEDLGVKVHLNKATKEIKGGSFVEGMTFNDGEELDVDMVVVSAGIRPRDELARACGLEVGERGGVVVNDQLQTSDPDIFAVGEVALHGSMIYGLVAPGYTMAETLAANLTGGDQAFTGADMSTKLKLMGIDVASFGNYTAPPDVAKSIVYEDPFAGVYKKIFFNLEGNRLMGGIMVGDADDYATLSVLAKGDIPLPCPPGELLVGQGGGVALGAADMPDDAQVCSCNNVTKGDICKAIKDGDLMNVGDVKRCSNAGTGCGGCMPLITNILKAELEASGKELSNNVCEHFEHTRQELYEIVKIKKIRTFDELIANHGKGTGCEACKPTVASILASLWNEHVIDHDTIQDTNDRFLGNIQRGGTYSVVPRVPGGEITPEKLIVLGEVAKKYGLYSKITGGQRVDLFGAPAHQLPTIWEELVDAGFESGHAYGKSLRTVKSCVGTTWCRYAVGNSVSFAIRVEERYRGLRSPHKLKSAVSGCVRECAEAQSKDFGIIATDKGWNLYVCGNGGASPRHADLMAADIDEETCIKYIDRFLMYYVQTADKLMRTARWIEELEGGIDYLKKVVIEDSLGIAQELETQMQFLVDTYKCEWKEVVKNPEKRRRFEQFVNTDETEPGIELIDERGQKRPIDWLSDEQLVQLELPVLDEGAVEEENWNWVDVGSVAEFPRDGGAAVKYGRSQLAVFHSNETGQWYATQNMCPHKREFVLSRGIIGDQAGVPKVACPTHKKTFSLETGTCLTGEDLQIHTFDVRLEGDRVEVRLPPVEVLDEILAIDTKCVHVCS